MGGRGSGRQASHGLLSNKCEDYSHTIDVAWMKREGCLVFGRNGTISWSRSDKQTGHVRYGVEAHGVRLTYKLRSGDDPWTEIDELVPVSYTATNFGGQRPWFLCPGCEHRSRILYGAGLFRCRKCLNLKYESQYEPDFARAVTQSHKLRKKLGHSGSLDDPFPQKPKGMHWRTYERLMAKDEEFQLAWCRRLSKWLDGFHNT